MAEETLIYSSLDVVKMINEKGDMIMSRIITDTINAHVGTASKLKRNYDRYTTDSVPINKRQSLTNYEVASDIRVNSDFPGDIVDQVRGFVFGEDIRTTYPEDAGDNIIKDFISENSLNALDTELAEYMLATGVGSRLLYVEAGTGLKKVINTKPWQTVFIINDTTEEIDFAMIYYDWTMINPLTGKATKTTRVEWYDKTNVSYYVKNGGRFVLDQSDVFENGEIVQPKNPQAHMFEFVPVVKFKPNPREQCAFAKVESLIDGYDVALSDWLNEIVEFRNAYLVATGGSVDEEEKRKIKQTGIVNLPDKDAKMEFLVKNLNPDFIERLIKTLDQNIYRFSKTMDMHNEKFVGGGPESGEARKWRLLSLVFEGIVIEKFFTKGLRQQYKVLCSAWNKGSVNIDFKQIKFAFTRSLPVDMLYYSQIITGLFGKMPIEDIYRLVPFIKDAAALAEKFQQENTINLDKVSLQPNNQDNSVQA